MHEPPLFGVLDEGSAEAIALAEVEAGPLAEVGRRIAAGDHAGAAEQFVEEVALGPGSWAQLPEAMRATMTGNAPTFLDELNDPEWNNVDEHRLAQYDGPVLMTSGDQSPPIFAAGGTPARPTSAPGQADDVRRSRPHPARDAPQEYVAEVVTFIESAEASQR